MEWKVRCGICDAINDMESKHFGKGDLFQCGWCCGLTVVNRMGPICSTRRRRPREDHEDVAWPGMVSPS